ncbi:hypothetical protein HOO65_030394 [Ceratocystis lukuohia]|uniref:Uncharacterized protein n=1 Tax=Ceratocystis lukuohia TaxID=2019550 RepID=A0ABR4MKR4_9PEZI
MPSSINETSAPINSNYFRSGLEALLSNAYTLMPSCLWDPENSIFLCHTCKFPLQGYSIPPEWLGEIYWPEANNILPPPCLLIPHSPADCYVHIFHATYNALIDGSRASRLAPGEPSASVHTNPIVSGLVPQVQAQAQAEVEAEVTSPCQLRPTAPAFVSQPITPLCDMGSLGRGGSSRPQPMTSASMHPITSDDRKQPATSDLTHSPLAFSGEDPNDVKIGAHHLASLLFSGYLQHHG